MAFTTDYYVSGVWFAEKGGSKYISHVLLHRATIDGWDIGTKAAKDDVIKLLDKQKIIRTVIWDYKEGDWRIGAPLFYEALEGVRHLRTKGDANVRDNLDNLIRMRAILK